jgi:ParB/RepB/Spo0J family partition protein
MSEYPKYVEKFPIEKLTVNGWNPNEMDTATIEKLKKSILDRKFIVPIVANKDGIIVDGEHRYLASIQLNESGQNIKEVPVVLVDMEEDEMKMSTIGLNNIRGCDSPLKLAKLLQDLNQRYSLSEISERVGYGSDEMQDKIELLKMPEDAIQKLKESAKLQEQEVPVVLHFMIAKEQEVTIEEALKKFSGISKGERLFALCLAHLK